VEQEIGHLCMVLTHGAIDMPTGSLLCASLEQAQLEVVGLGTPFLDKDFAAYGFLLMDCLWKKTIWEFVSSYEICLLVHHDQVLPKLQWKNDHFIMEALHPVWS
jgi:hypothetical protein